MNPRPKPTVILTPYEMLEAAMAGAARQVENVAAHRKNAHGLEPGKDWQVNIEGTLVERSLAKYLNRYWPGKGKMRAPDVGDSQDVRGTPDPTNRLILHKRDDPNRVYWLLAGLNGTYIVQGWILGSEGKDEKYWADPAGGRPAYFVPLEALHNPEDFPHNFG